MDWQDFFSDAVLSKGYVYQTQHAVKELTKEENRLTALVSGTKDYKVTITFAGDVVVATQCTCPQAALRKNCKHMAAVLFECESRVASNKTGTAGEAEEGSDRPLPVPALGQKDTRKPLSLKPKTAAKDLSGYKERIQAIRQKLEDKDQSITFDEAERLISDLTACLKETIHVLLEEGFELEAFDLSADAIKAAGLPDLGDSSESVKSFKDECLTIWRRILAQADLTEKTRIYEHLVRALDEPAFGFMGNYIEQIIMEDFKEGWFLQKKVDLTLKKADFFLLHEDPRTADRYGGKWAIRHIRLLEENGSTWPEIEAYCTGHWKAAAVRKYYIEQCVARKDYTAVIELLERSQKLSFEPDPLVPDEDLILKNLYLVTGSRTAYMNQLWHIVINVRPGDLKIFQELKAQYSGTEWPQVREKIFQALPQGAALAELFKEEELYDRLLDYVRDSNGILAADRYAGELKERYAKELLEKYSEELDKIARSPSARSRHKEAAEVLAKILAIPGGKAQVTSLRKKWRALYSNDPDLTDELDTVER